MGFLISLGAIQKMIYQCFDVTNSAFQSGGVLLNILSALAIHLLKCVAKAHTRQDSFNTCINY